MTGIALKIQRAELYQCPLMRQPEAPVERSQSRFEIFLGAALRWEDVGRRVTRMVARMSERARRDSMNRLLENAIRARAGRRPTANFCHVPAWDRFGGPSARPRIEPTRPRTSAIAEPDGISGSAGRGIAVRAEWTMNTNGR